MAIALAPVAFVSSFAVTTVVDGYVQSVTPLVGVAVTILLLARVESGSPQGHSWKELIGSGWAGFIHEYVAYNVEMSRSRTRALKTLVWICWLLPAVLFGVLVLYAAIDLLF